MSGDGPFVLREAFGEATTTLYYQKWKIGRFALPAWERGRRPPFGHQCRQNLLLFRHKNVTVAYLNIKSIKHQMEPTNLGAQQYTNNRDVPEVDRIRSVSSHTT